MDKINALCALFQAWSEEKAKNVKRIPAHGSSREYYRIFGETLTAIGAYNDNRKENIAFITFSKHFRQLGLPVPEIYGEDIDNGVYLEQDFGDVTLFSFLSKIRVEEGFSTRIVDMYKQAICLLPHFQINAAKNLDYTLCYPRGSFDRQSMMWDLHYFKYHFIKLVDIDFDEQLLEDDFNTFADFLLQADSDFFLYRDFQSRNIMIVDDKPYFIDYQGGRKGALQYDLASLLYDAKAGIPQNIREELLHYYIECAGKLRPIDSKSFLDYYYGYVLIRIMQALGAYGFRGFYQRKEHFLLSIPYALKNLKWLLDNVELPIKIPTLQNVWQELVKSKKLLNMESHPKLTVRIHSFSYKYGMPYDETGHGGGFVFDCRLLPNPGRIEKYAKLTGESPEIIVWLQKEQQVQDFLKHVVAIIDQAVRNYQKRDFTSLMVSFGCTGGQHRSVFCANWLCKYLLENFAVNAQVRHTNLERLRA